MSTPLQRMNFLIVLEGSGGGALPGLAANVANCPLPMPESACNLLGLLPGSTFRPGRGSAAVPVGERAGRLLMQTPPSILAVMDHPSILGPFFEGGSWTARRAFLAALFALPMSDDHLALHRHHTGRQEPPAAPFSEAALVCGRRGGKSRILALIATYLATFRDYAPHLAPGEVATIAIIAADRKQARAIFRYLVGMLQGGAVVRESDRGADGRHDHAEQPGSNRDRDGELPGNERLHFRGLFV